ncbi:hypothetical protein MATL_G00080910 [Megalops atlanticus]|uniref:Uncharacterized protein n=1 Tax=Megalops atlanticus TaxID=7932 RepID=A0A9D3TFH8_MEGAT|nr:hypothetical protein MATL_G00080910 [Megalops atlanticus]
MLDNQLSFSHAWTSVTPSLLVFLPVPSNLIQYTAAQLVYNLPKHISYTLPHLTDLLLSLALSSNPWRWHTGQ